MLSSSALPFLPCVALLPSAAEDDGGKDSRERAELGLRSRGEAAAPVSTLLFLLRRGDGMSAAVGECWMGGGVTEVGEGDSADMTHEAR